MGSSLQRLQLMETLALRLADAVESQRLLHTAMLASELFSRFPACDMTLSQIEDEIIWQVGRARGAAEIGEGSGADWPAQPGN